MDHLLKWISQLHIAKLEEDFFPFFQECMNSSGVKIVFVQMLGDEKKQIKKMKLLVSAKYNLVMIWETLVVAAAVELFGWEFVCVLWSAPENPCRFSDFFYTTGFYVLHSISSPSKNESVTLEQKYHVRFLKLLRAWLNGHL